MDAVFASSLWVDDAVEALEQGHVYVADDAVAPADLPGVIESEIGDSSVGVAVFSSHVTLQAEPRDILSTLLESTTHDTIVISIDGDLWAGSHVLPSDEAMTIANEAEQSAGNLQSALIETVAEIRTATDAVEVPAASVDGGVIVALAIAAAALVAGGATVWGVLRSRRRRNSRDQPQRSIPEGVSARIAALRALRPAYAAAANPIAAQTATDIDAITTNVTELFVRLDARTDTVDQRGLAAIEYDEKLRKLQAALDREYLLDILTHPHLWDDPDERIAEVRHAVTAVSDEVLQNVKQVNARRALHFQVSLDGLIGGRKELREWDRAFDSAADDGHTPPTG